MSEALPQVTVTQQPVTSWEPATAVGDVVEWDGTQWVITQPLGIADPLVVSDAVPADTVAPGDVTKGILYKQAASDGLWWITDGIGPVDLTVAALAAPHAPVSMNVFMVNPALPAISNNYTTVAAAVAAAVLTVPTAAAPATVYITPGTYNEAITFGDNIYLTAPAPNTVFLTQTASTAGVIEFGMNNINFESAAGPALDFAGGVYTVIAKHCTFSTSDAAAAAIKITAGTVQTSRFEDCLVVNTNVLGKAVETAVGSAGALSFSRCVLGRSAAGVSYDNELLQASAGGIFTYYCNGRVWWTVTDGSGLAKWCNFSCGATANPMFTITAPGYVDASNNSFFSGPVGVTGDYATGTGELRYGGNTLRQSGATVNITRSVTTETLYEIDGAVSDNITSNDLNVHTVNPNQPTGGQNYQTIQAAINAAEALNPTNCEEIVLVTPGEYNEALIISKAIVLKSTGIASNGSAGTVIVDGGDLGDGDQGVCLTVRSRCTVEGIFFRRSITDGSLIVLSVIKWPAFSGIGCYMKDCYVENINCTVNYAIDWSAANGTFRRRLTMHNTPISNDGGATPLSILTGGANGNVVSIYDNTQFSFGVIEINGGRVKLNNSDWIGRIFSDTTVGPSIPPIGFSATDCYMAASAMACIDSDQANFRVSLNNVRMNANSGAPAAINLTGATSVVKTSNVHFTDGSVDTVINSGVGSTHEDAGLESTVGYDLGVLTVNPAKPEVGRNYQTIQAAIDAAELVIGVTVTYMQTTILITPGIYTEDLTISKKLHLKGMNGGSGSSAASVKLKAATAACNIKAGCTFENLTLERDIAGVGAVSAVSLDALGAIATDADVDNPNTTVNFVNCVFSGLSSTSVNYVVDIGTAQTNPCLVEMHNCRSSGTGNFLHSGGANVVKMEHCSDFNGAILVDSSATNALFMQYSTLVGAITVNGAAAATQTLHVINSRIATAGDFASITAGKVGGTVRLEKVSFYNSSGTFAVIDITVAGTSLAYADLIFNPLVGGGGTLLPAANDTIDSNTLGSAPVAIDVVPTIVA